jgi:DNA polymerase-3 subunit beta
MKITLDRRELAETLKWVTAALDKRPATLAMGGVRISVTETDVTLTAWDYAAAHSARINVAGAEPGELLVPGATLSAIVGAMRGKDVVLAESGNQLEVACGSSTYRLQLLPLGDYMAPPAPPAQIGTVSGPSLAGAVAAVEWAAARDSMIGSIFQIHMEVVGDSLVVAATNRFVFGVDSCAYEGERFIAGIQPSMLTGAIAGVADEPVVGIGLSDSLLSLIGESRTVSLRLVSDPFVDWRAALNVNLPEQLKVDAGELADAGRRVAALAAKDAAVRVTLTAEDVTLSASSEAGEGHDLIEGVATTPYEFGFNPSYLAAALKHFDGEVVIAYSADAERARPWRIESPTLPGRTSIVMPKRVLA